ncbi:MAG: hypothetical protein ACTSWY_05525 [Promethearchaeota archaeon]
MFHRWRYKSRMYLSFPHNLEIPFKLAINTMRGKHALMPCQGNALPCGNHALSRRADASAWRPRECRTISRAVLVP